MKIKQRNGVATVWMVSLLLVAPAVKGADQGEAADAKASELSLLTVDKAVEQALENNLEYKARLESVGVAGGGLTQAAKRPNPELELGVKSDRLFAHHGEREFSAGLAQTFETAGKRRYRVLAARSHLEKVRSDVENFERALVAEVKSAFYTALAAERNLKLVKETVRFTENFVSTQTARWKEGDISELELNLAKVELSRVRRGQMQAETARRTAMLRLNRLMGLPYRTDLKLAGEFAPVLPEYDVETLVDFAAHQRPDLKSLENELKWQEYDLLLKKAEAWPNLKLGLDFTQKRDVFEAGDVRYFPPQDSLPPPIIFFTSNQESPFHSAFRGTTARFGKTVPHGPGPGPDPSQPLGAIASIASQHWLLRFRLSVPLPLFNRNQGNIESAVAGRRAARLKLNYQRELVKHEIATAYDTLRLAHQARELYETGILPQLRENLHIVTESYQLGAQSILAVIQEQRTFLDVNTQYLQTLAEFQSAVVRLESALGGKISDVGRR